MRTLDKAERQNVRRYTNVLYYVCVCVCVCLSVCVSVCGFRFAESLTQASGHMADEADGAFAGFTYAAKEGEYLDEDM